jgi:hypothetical protein
MTKSFVLRGEHFVRRDLLWPAWTLTKGTEPPGQVWSHVLGFELRASLGSELVQSQVCRVAGGTDSHV